MKKLYVFALSAAAVLVAACSREATSVDEGLISKDKEEPETPTGAMTFRDSVAEVACIEKFDANADGVLSYEEAAAVIDISGLFSEYTGVVHFDELRYFTSLSSIGIALKGLTKLESVIIPAQITSIPNYAFDGCTKLYSVTFPENVTTIGDRAFYNCLLLNPATTVSKVSLPASVTFIGVESFNAVKNVLVNSTADVSIASNSFGSTTKIYVPDANVESYKIKSNWANYADRIFALSSYVDKSIYEYVDLGLSVKWATFNVGAHSPEGYGDYFAWGETQGYNDGKTYYDWPTYKWCKGSFSTLTKYNAKADYGTVDSKTVLDLEDDVAHVKWGGSWRMPTAAEWTELREKCTWTSTTLKGVNGRLVTSNKEGYTDKSIFLPVAGYRSGGSLFGQGSYGYYWSSSLSTIAPYYAGYVFLDSGSVHWNSNNRYYGQSVRPVSE